AHSTRSSSTVWWIRGPTGGSPYRASVRLGHGAPRRLRTWPGEAGARIPGAVPSTEPSPALGGGHDRIAGLPQPSRRMPLRALHADGHRDHRRAVGDGLGPDLAER